MFGNGAIELLTAHGTIQRLLGWAGGHSWFGVSILKPSCELKLTSVNTISPQQETDRVNPVQLFSSELVASTLSCTVLAHAVFGRRPSHSASYQKYVDVGMAMRLAYYLGLPYIR